MPVKRIVTAADLEFGTIDWTRENRALKALIDRHGWTRHPVESLALHAYRKKSDPNSISCMVSFGLGGDAIVRFWYKGMKSPRWQAFWAMMLGDTPVPKSMHEAQARRHELIRPAFLDLDREDGFWRVTGVDYAADEEVEATADMVPA